MTEWVITLVSFAKSKNKEADKFLITYVLKHALIWLWQIEKAKQNKKTASPAELKMSSKSKFFFQYILLHLLVSLYLVACDHGSLCVRVCVLIFPLMKVSREAWHRSR